MRGKSKKFIEVELPLVLGIINSITLKKRFFLLTAMRDHPREIHALAKVLLKGNRLEDHMLQVEREAEKK